MNVQELIAYLEKLPKDAVIGIVYRAYSDYSLLEEDELDYYPSGSLQHGRKRFVLRNGKIMQYDEKTWDKREVPHFVPILAFPGN